MSESSEELKRIANAIEEILKLVKLDQEATKKRFSAGNCCSARILKNSLPTAPVAPTIANLILDMIDNYFC